MSNFINATKPFIATVGVLFAFLAALKGVTEMFPTLSPVSVKATLKAVDLAVIGAALALAANVNLGQR